MVTLTDWAMKRTGKLHGECFHLMLAIPSFHDICVSEHEPKMWDNLKGHFMDHIEEVNAQLSAAGLPILGTGSQASPANDASGTNGVNGEH